MLPDEQPQTLLQKMRKSPLTTALLALSILLIIVIFLIPASTKSLISRPQALVLGVVEGVTEYLPVSSTGHLILFSHMMGLSHFGERAGLFGRAIEKSPAISAFEVVIQFGAILAVLGLYRKRVAQMAKGAIGRDPQGLRLLKMLVIGTIPALIAGLLLQKTIKAHLFGPLTVVVALLAGGVLMIVMERHAKRRNEDVRNDIDGMFYWQAALIGVFQVLAMWPGTSRSMITIVTAMVVGLKRKEAAEFSFLLALPTLGAATLYEAMKSRQELLDGVGLDVLILGTIVSALVAALAVKLFVTWLNRHGLVPFGVYRIVAGLTLLYYFRATIG